MRRILFDQEGNAVYYLTGAGVLFDAMNQAVGIVQREVGMLIEGKLEPVTGSTGEIVAWFDDSFLWTPEGELMAFIKGAKPEGDFKLPKTKKLVFMPKPQAAPFKPLLARSKPPTKSWVWAVHKLVQSQKEFYT